MMTASLRATATQARLYPRFLATTGTGLVADPPQPRKIALSRAAISASGSVATDAQHDHGADLKDVSDVAQRARHLCP
jgi:hypothetical protein